MSSPPVLAVLGEALIDLVEYGDDEPRLARPGGSPYNVAIGLARLGRHAAFVGRLSRDPLGQVLRRHAERSGVDLSRTVDAPQPSTVALVELSEAGAATYRFGVDGTADFVFTDGELSQ
ncbi:PfkB family carbohydrate kinase, partial [Jatrophihabitans endophyticus]|uniref:PfkB family carbohydrate kinase n=1 Tax=Jatrophihabitans endophyticus TaxID=1206085 RepID=UPI001A0769E6